MLHRILLLSIALVLALLVMPLAVLSPEGQAQALSRESAEGEGLSAQTQEEAPEDSEPPEPSAEETRPEEPSSEPQAVREPQAEPEVQADTLKVLLPDGTVTAMELEDYLWGVVAAEMPAAFQEEALKAQAVAARTYTRYQMAHPSGKHPEADICTDYNCCQAWISRADRLDKWPEDKGEEYAARIAAAVTETAGQVLTWEDGPILAVFHASSGGRTRSAQAVWGRDLPYLVSVESPEGEEDAPNYYSVVTMEAEEFSALFLAQHPEADLSGDCAAWFGEQSTDDSGALASVCVGGVTVSAQELRTLCALRSATFEVECQEDTITFYVTGYGHGVGMSQYGANVLAKEGASYTEILAHYYPGTTLEEETD